MPIAISELFLFPVKSLRGIAVKEAILNDTGFRWDRHWMIVKSNGGFITQRQFPKMVLIHTTIDNEKLTLSTSGMPDCSISLKAPNNPLRFTAKIWKDYCEVIDEGEDVGQWLTKALGAPKPLRLVRMANGYQRPQSKPQLLGEKTTTHFADAAPYLICNQQSLNALNLLLKSKKIVPITMEHFRPNIVIDGIDAFKEHTTHHLEHQNYQLTHCYPCQRCIVPTINIETGTPHPQQQPFSLISDLNSMPDNSKAPAFGENAILTNGRNHVIRIGDQLNAINK